MDSGLVLVTGNRGRKQFYSCRRFREFDRDGRYQRKERTKILKLLKVIKDNKLLQYLFEHLQLCKSLFRMIQHRPVRNRNIVKCDGQKVLNKIGVDVFLYYTKEN